MSCGTGRYLWQPMGTFSPTKPIPNGALFLHESLEFPEQNFGGALVWDTLQFLAPPLLEATVDRLYEVLRPGSTCSHFPGRRESPNRAAVLLSHRRKENDVHDSARPGRPVQYFNNRSLEKLFQKFQSVKFFLTRDHCGKSSSADSTPRHSRPSPRILVAVQNI